MKQKFLIINLIGIILITQGCQKNEHIVFDLDSVPVFKEEILYYSNQIILNATVEKNEIYLLNRSTFSNFTADSEKDNSSPLLDFNPSFFKKHCLSKNYLALTPILNSDQFIKFNTTNEHIFFNEELTLSVDKIGGVPTDSNLDYSHLNDSGFDNCAINEYDKAILPVIKKPDSSAIVFILFDLRYLVGTANPNNYDYPYNPDLNLPKDHYFEIVFPHESTRQLNRMESFRQNFYVSSAENTYLIRPDGSFQFIMEGSANDFFEFNGKIYADFGDRIAYTDDDGKTWSIQNDTPEFNGFREFQDIYGHLVFFNKDNLYLVDTADFSYSILDNKGLEHSQITAILPFYKRIYVATLNGLFHKPIETLTQ